MVHIYYSQVVKMGILCTCMKTHVGFATGLATGLALFWVGLSYQSDSGHKGAVWSAKLSGRDASRAVTGSADFSAKVWDTYTGECVQTFTHNHIVRSVAVNRAGTQMLTGGHEKKLRLFDLQRPAGGSADEALVFKPSPGCESGTTHKGIIRSVVLGRGTNGAENTVVTAAEDKSIQWWDLRSMKAIHEMTLDEPFTSVDRCVGTFGEYISITAGKKAMFVDLLRLVPALTQSRDCKETYSGCRPFFGLLASDQS